MQGGFGGVVDGSPDIWDDACDRADLHDCTMAPEKKGGENSAHAYYSKDIGIKNSLNFSE